MWHGPKGLRQIARRCRFYAQILHDELEGFGYHVVTLKDNHFDTITIDVIKSGFPSSDFVVSEFHKNAINLRKVDNNLV